MIGRGRKGLSTKLHLSLSPSGIQSACLSEGQRVDMKAFSQLWEKGEWENIQYVIADKGYDYFDVRDPIRKAGKIPVIPRRANATVPGLPDIYKPYYYTRSAIDDFLDVLKKINA